MKHPAPPAEVEALARRLRETRRQGQPVGAWLEQQAAYLRSLIPKRSGGFTWAQVAEAMNQAGITYAEGRRLPIGGTSRGRWPAGQIRLAASGAAQLSEARRKALDAGRAPENPRAETPTVPPPAVHEPAAEAPAKPKVRVFGLDPPQRSPETEPEPSEMQKHIDEKAARTRAILDDYFRRRQHDG